MKTKEVEYLDEVSEQLLKDDDVNSLLDSYSRGHLSDTEALELLQYLKQRAEFRAQGIVYGPHLVDRSGHDADYDLEDRMINEGRG